MIVNLSRVAERAAPVVSSIEPNIAPPREKETKPNTGVNRLSAKLYGDLQQRIKHLELSYMRQEHVPIRMYAAFQIVRNLANLKLFITP